MVGRSIRLNRVGFTVIGVAPPGFEGAVGGLGFDLFIPHATGSQIGENSPLGSREAVWVYGIARLQPGIAVSQAQALARTVTHQLATAYPDTNRDRALMVLPLWQCPGLTVVSPGHLENLQVPLLEGRGLTEADDTESPGVVVVNAE